MAQSKMKSEQSSVVRRVLQVYSVSYHLLKHKKAVVPTEEFRILENLAVCGDDTPAQCTEPQTEGVWPGGRLTHECLLKVARALSLNVSENHVAKLFDELSGKDQSDPICITEDTWRREMAEGMRKRGGGGATPNNLVSNHHPDDAQDSKPQFPDDTGEGQGREKWHQVGQKAARWQNILNSLIDLTVTMHSESMSLMAAFEEARTISSTLEKGGIPIEAFSTFVFSRLHLIMSQDNLRMLHAYMDADGEGLISKQSWMATFTQVHSVMLSAGDKLVLHLTKKGYHTKQGFEWFYESIKKEREAAREKERVSKQHPPGSQGDKEKRSSQNSIINADLQPGLVLTLAQQIALLAAMSDPNQPNSFSYCRWNTFLDSVLALPYASGTSVGVEGAYEMRSPVLPPSLSPVSHVASSLSPCSFTRVASTSSLPAVMPSDMCACPYFEVLFLSPGSFNIGITHKAGSSEPSDLADIKVSEVAAPNSSTGGTEQKTEQTCKKADVWGCGVVSWSQDAGKKEPEPSSSRKLTFQPIGSSKDAKSNTDKPKNIVGEEAAKPKDGFMLFWTKNGYLVRTKYHKGRPSDFQPAVRVDGRAQLEFTQNSSPPAAVAIFLMPSLRSQSSDSNAPAADWEVAKALVQEGEWRRRLFDGEGPAHAIARAGEGTPTDKKTEPSREKEVAEEEVAEEEARERLRSLRRAAATFVEWQQAEAAGHAPATEGLSTASNARNDLPNMRDASDDVRRMASSPTRTAAEAVVSPASWQGQDPWQMFDPPKQWCTKYSDRSALKKGMEDSGLFLKSDMDAFLDLVVDPESELQELCGTRLRRALAMGAVEVRGRETRDAIKCGTVLASILCLHDVSASKAYALLRAEQADNTTFRIGGLEGLPNLKLSKASLAALRRRLDPDPGQISGTVTSEDKDTTAVSKKLWTSLFEAAAQLMGLDESQKGKLLAPEADADGPDIGSKTWQEKKTEAGSGDQDKGRNSEQGKRTGLKLQGERNRLLQLFRQKSGNKIKIRRRDLTKMLARLGIVNTTDSGRASSKKKGAGSESNKKDMEKEEEAWMWSIFEFENSVETNRLATTLRKHNLDHTLAEALMKQKPPMGTHRGGVGDFLTSQDLLSWLVLLEESKREVLLEKVYEEAKDGIIKAMQKCINMFAVKSVSAKESKVKFATDLKMASFGVLDDFNKGLEAYIGMPSPNVEIAIRNEHLGSEDSKVEFTALNTSIKTTPEKEYNLIMTDESTYTGGRRGGSISFFLGKSKAKRAGLTRAEVIALRLFTGPMYQEYNTVLRNIPKSSLRAGASTKYVSTIHAIVSAVVKLSKTWKLPDSRKVYRGLNGVELPEHFWNADEFGCKGGVEYGLMSTTTDITVAIQYSKGRHPIVFEIDVGQVDRGAELSWISQYKGEQEVLMPPLSNLEVMGNPYMTAVESDGDGSETMQVLMVPLRVNVNLKSRTIEELISANKKVFMSALQDLNMDVRKEVFNITQAREEAGRFVAQPGTAHGLQVVHRPLKGQHGETEWFNDHMSPAELNALRTAVVLSPIEERVHCKKTMLQDMITRKTACHIEYEPVRGLLLEGLDLLREALPVASPLNASSTSLPASPLPDTPATSNFQGLLRVNSLSSVKSKCPKHIQKERGRVKRELSKTELKRELSKSADGYNSAADSTKPEDMCWVLRGVAGKQALADILAGEVEKMMSPKMIKEIKDINENQEKQEEDKVAEKEALLAAGWLQFLPCLDFAKYTCRRQFEHHAELFHASVQRLSVSGELRRLIKSMEGNIMIDSTQFERRCRTAMHCLEVACQYLPLSIPNDGSLYQIPDFGSLNPCEVCGEPGGCWTSEFKGAEPKEDGSSKEMRISGAEGSVRVVPENLSPSASCAQEKELRSVGKCLLLMDLDDPRRHSPNNNKNTSNFIHLEDVQSVWEARMLGLLSCRADKVRWKKADAVEGGPKTEEQGSLEAGEKGNGADRGPHAEGKAVKNQSNDGSRRSSRTSVQEKAGSDKEHHLFLSQIMSGEMTEVKLSRPVPDKLLAFLAFFVAANALNSVKVQLEAPKGDVDTELQKLVYTDSDHDASFDSRKVTSKLESLSLRPGGGLGDTVRIDDGGHRILNLSTKGVSLTMLRLLVEAARADTELRAAAVEGVDSLDVANQEMPDDNEGEGEGEGEGETVSRGKRQDGPDHIFLSKNELGRKVACDTADGKRVSSMTLLGDLIKIGAGNLNFLELSHNELGPKMAGDLFQSFRKQKVPNLTRLYLNNNELGDEGLRELATTIEQGMLPKLQTLRLANNRVGGDGVRELAMVLPKSSVAAIDISENKIGSEGFVALCTQTSQCTALTELDVSSNSICDLGISQVLAGNESEEDRPLKHLKKLFLSQNNLTEDGALKLLSSMQGEKNLKIEFLSLDQNMISSDGLENIAKRMEAVLDNCQKLDRFNIEKQRSITELLAGDKHVPVKDGAEPTVWRHLHQLVLSPQYNSADDLELETQAEAHKGKMADALKKFECCLRKDLTKATSGNGAAEPKSNTGSSEMPSQLSTPASKATDDVDRDLCDQPDPLKDAVTKLQELSAGMQVTESARKRVLATVTRLKEKEAGIEETKKQGKARTELKKEWLAAKRQTRSLNRQHLRTVFGKAVRTFEKLRQEQEAIWPTWFLSNKNYIEALQTALTAKQECIKNFRDDFARRIITAHLPECLPVHLQQPFCLRDMEDALKDALKEATDFPEGPEIVIDSEKFGRLRKDGARYAALLLGCKANDFHVLLVSKSQAAQDSAANDDKRGEGDADSGPAHSSKTSEVKVEQDSVAGNGEATQNSDTGAPIVAPGQTVAADERDEAVLERFFIPWCGKWIEDTRLAVRFTTKPKDLTSSSTPTQHPESTSESTAYYTLSVMARARVDWGQDGKAILQDLQQTQHEKIDLYDPTRVLGWKKGVGKHNEDVWEVAKKVVNRLPSEMLAEPQCSRRLRAAVWCLDRACRSLPLTPEDDTRYYETPWTGLLSDSCKCPQSLLQLPFEKAVPEHTVQRCLELFCHEIYKLEEGEFVQPSQAFLKLELASGRRDMRSKSSTVEDVWEARVLASLCIGAYQVEWIKTRELVTGETTEVVYPVGEAGREMMTKRKQAAYLVHLVATSCVNNVQVSFCRNKNERTGKLILAPGGGLDHYVHKARLQHDRYALSELSEEEDSDGSDLEHDETNKGKEMGVLILQNLNLCHETLFFLVEAALAGAQDHECKCDREECTVHVDQHGLDVRSIDLGQNPGLREHTAEGLPSTMQMIVQLAMLTVGNAGGNLRELHLDGCCINDEGVTELCEHFEKNKQAFGGNLEHLQLSDNEITDDGAKSLAGAIEKSEVLPKLMSLDLQDNRLTQDGKSEVRKAFKEKWPTALINTVGRDKFDGPGESAARACRRGWLGL